MVPRLSRSLVTALVLLVVASRGAEATVVDQTDIRLGGIDYRIERLTDANRDLSARFGGPELALLEKLNRADATRLRRLNWYFNFHNRRGLAFHEFDLPGVPASHACVRLLARDAEWIYQWGESWTLDAKGQLQFGGTPVLISGAYNFSLQAPWQTLDYWSRTIVLPETLAIQ